MSLPHSLPSSVGNVPRLSLSKSRSQYTLHRSFSHRNILRLRRRAASFDHIEPKIQANRPEPIQLNDESDFYQLLSPDGRISISGFGSLLSRT